MIDVGELVIKKVFLDENGAIVIPASKKSKTPLRISKVDDVNKPNGHWEFPDQMGTKDFYGFIYAIFDPHTKRGYIGKKQYFGGGKLNKGKVSDWRRYTSSNKELMEAIRQRGIINFRFIVLEQYKIRGTLTYAETWTQCFVETPTSDVWYNTRVEEVSWNVKERITDRHKERLNMIIEMVGV